MTRKKWLTRVFDNNIARGVGLILIVALLYRSFFHIPFAGYVIVESKYAEITALRPVQSRFGGYSVLVSYSFEDGSQGTLLVPETDVLGTGRKIYIDVLKKPGKRDRYRLAQPANQP